MQTVVLALPPGEFETQIRFGCSISPGTTLLVERGVFDRVGLFDEDLRRLEDWDWLLRFAERHDILFLPEVLATIYFNEPSSRSGSDELDIVQHAIDRIGEKHIPHMRTKGTLALRQFRSTLLVEKAARMFHNRRPWGAVFYVIASLMVFPFRSSTFFQTLWRSAASAMTRGWFGNGTKSRLQRFGDG
jgi:hypothetical protein